MTDKNSWVYYAFGDRKGRNTVEPEPVDDKPAPEIRGGNRPADWVTQLGGKDADGEFTGIYEKDGCPGHPDDNKWAAIHEPDEEDDE
jgi:hypothetical protein